MPLIRLVSCPKYKNKWLCDQMIFIEGLPDKMLYWFRNGKKYLKEPWVADVTENIPEYVRNVLVPEPIKMNFYSPPFEKGAPPIDEERDIYGISIDYQSGQGETIWNEVDRILEMDTPRGERIPEPVKVVVNGDNDHRDIPFNVPVEEIPVIHLKGSDRKENVIQTTLLSYKCPECGKEFDKPKALSMHQMKLRHNKVAVGV